MMTTKPFRLLAALALFLPSLAIADINTAQVSVGTGTTLVVAARSGRASVTIINWTQAVAFCFGPVATITASANSACLPAVAGASVTLNTAAALYGVWADGGTHTVSFVENY